MDIQQSTLHTLEYWQGGDYQALILSRQPFPDPWHQGQRGISMQFKQPSTAPIGHALLCHYSAVSYLSWQRIEGDISTSLPKDSKSRRP